jgi:hypothetical protein
MKNRRSGLCVLLLCLGALACSKDGEKKDKAPAAEAANEAKADNPYTEKLKQKALEDLCNAHVTSRADGTVPERLRLMKEWARKTINNPAVSPSLFDENAWFDLKQASKEIAAVAPEDCTIVEYFQVLSRSALSVEEAEQLVEALASFSATSDSWTRTASLASTCSRIPGCSRECALTLWAISKAPSEAEASNLLARCPDLVQSTDTVPVATHLRDRVLRLLEPQQEAISADAQKILEAEKTKPAP